MSGFLCEVSYSFQPLEIKFVAIIIIIGIIDEKVFKENSVKLRNSFAKLLAIRRGARKPTGLDETKKLHLNGN